MTTLREITNIVFDLSEVLLTGIKDTGVALREKHRIEVVADHHLGSHSSIRTPLLVPLVEELFHGNVSEKEYLNSVVQTYPQIGSEMELRQLIRKNFQEIKGTREIILELKRLRYTLALLSVHAKEWVDYCEKKFDFHRLFDVRIYSYETKVSKPHPDAFRGMLKTLQTTPGKCVFIDDSETNVRAAEALGISGIVFTDAENLRTQLAEILPDFK